MSDNAEPIASNAQTASAKGGNFLTDVFVRVLAQAFAGIRGLIYLPIIAKTFGTTEVGIWTQTLAIAALLVPLWTLGLETASVRYLAGEQDEDKIGRMVGTLLMFQAVVVGLALTLGLGLSSVLVGVLFGENVPVIFVLLLMALVAIKTYSYLLLFMFRAFGRIKLFSLIEVIQNLIEIIAVVVVVLLLGFGLVGAISVFIATELLIAVTLFVLLQRFAAIRFGWEWRELRRYLRYSLPLLPSNFFVWVTNVSDRLVITWFLGIGVTSIYATTYMLGQGLTLLHAPITFVLFPAIAKAWTNNNIKGVRRYITGSLALYLIFCAPAVVALIVTGPYVLRLLTTSEFVTDPLLIGAVAIGLSTLGVYKIGLYVIHLYERTDMLMALYGFIAALNFVGNLILVPRIGIFGPALTTFVCYLLQLFAIMYLARRFSSTQLIIWPPVWKYLLAAAPGLLLLFFPPPANLWQFIASLTVIGVSYAGLLLALKAVTIDELRDVLERFSLRRRARGAVKAPQV